MPKETKIHRLDSHLRPLKVDGETSALEISTNQIKAPTITCTDLNVEGASTGVTADAPEGTAVLSTGEGGGSKFLREDGDGTCSWQTVSSGASALNDLSDVTYSSGDLTISSLDKIVADDFVVDSGDSIELDAHNGAFVAKKAGTQFSVADSAYAGMILGYNTVGIDATTASTTLGTSFSVINSNHKVKFVAPPSGVVEIFVSVFMDVNRRTIHFGLSDNATYNAVDVTHEHIIMQLPGTDIDRQVNHRWVITGLTAGTSYEYWLGAKCTHAFVTSMKWGGDATGEYQPFIMKATALPKAVTDYAVYG